MTINSFYLIRGMIFEKTTTKNNAYYRALNYCKKEGIDVSEIVEIYNDDELAYYKYLVEKGYQVKTHTKMVLCEAFTNYNGDEIPSITLDIPFTYIDENGKTNYVFLIRVLYEIDNRLLLLKKIFDREHKDDNYLKMVWLNVKGEYIEWKIGHYADIKKDFQSQEHMFVLAKHKAIRERQKYDRLLKLRIEGKITDNQKKELYRLEAIYGDVGN